MGLGDIIGGVGSLIGGISGSANQAKANANSAAAAQAQQQINQQAVNAAQGQLGAFNQSYAPAIGATGSDYASLASGPGSQAASLAQTLIQAGLNPNAVAAITGINANQLVGGATSYLGNPNSSPLAQAFPGLQSFFQNEQQQGINPQFAQNAQNQLQQNAAQQQSDLLHHALPGQNIAGQQQQITNSLLQNSTNLAGNLAGQSQQFSQQGAQGLQGLAQMLGTEQATNLQNAATLGSNYNQQQLGNIAGAQGTAQNALQALLPFLNQGFGLQESGISNMTNVGTQYGNLAAGAATQAANYGNPWQTAISNIGGSLGSTNLFGNNPVAQEQLTPLPAPVPTNYGGTDFAAQSPWNAGLP